MAAAGLTVLATILTIAVLHFTNVFDVTKWFKEQDITYKASYTASLTKVERNGKRVVAKVGNQKLTNSELQIHYWNGVWDYVQEYGGYVKLMGMDPEVPLDQQTHKESGLTYQQWFLQNAIESWRRFAILVQMSEDAGYQMTPEQQQELDNIPNTIAAQALEEGFADTEAYVEKYYPGSSVEGFVQYNANLLKAMYYFDAVYESLMPNEQEVEAYYAQNEATFQKGKKAKEDGLYHDIRHIYLRIPTEIGDINGKPAHTQKEWDDNLPNAEKVLADFKAAGGTEEAFIQLVKTVSDPDYQVNDGLVTKLTKHTIIAEDPDEPFAEAFKNWYLDPARKAGDVEIIKDDNGSVQGYQIMYYCGGTAIWRYEAQTLLLSEKTNAMLAEAEAKWQIDVKYSRILLGMPENVGATETTAPAQ